MTHLRKMMLEELQRRNYSQITTRNYLRVVTEFAKYLGKSPDKLGPERLPVTQEVEPMAHTFVKAGDQHG